MNKYLMLSAAAAMSTGIAGSADAGSYSVHLLGAYGTSYCDALVFTTHGDLAAGQHVYSNCSESWLHNIQIIGTKSKNKVQGKAWYFSDDSFAMSMINLGYGPSTAFSYADMWAVAAPIVTGKAWYLWVSFGGTSAFLANQGTYTLGTLAKGNGKNGNRQTSTVKVSELIRAALNQAAKKP